MILVNLLSFFLFLPRLASLLVLFASHVWLSLFCVSGRGEQLQEAQLAGP